MSDSPTPILNHQILADLHYYLLNLHLLSKGAPIAEKFLVMFLVQRVYSKQIPAILETAERLQMLRRLPNTDTYLPLPIEGFTPPARKYTD